MTPLVLLEKDIDEEHLSLYRAAKTLVEQMEDGLTCHDVCARLAEALGVRHVRGWFAARGIQHSWIRLDDDTILDPYPWACGSGPILVTTRYLFNPWRRLYIEDDGGRDLGESLGLSGRDLGLSSGVPGG